MNFALVSASLTANETIAPLQGKASLPSVGSGAASGWKDRKYLARSAGYAGNALKPATPPLIAKPRLKIHDGHGFRVVVVSATEPALRALRSPIASLKPMLRRRIGNISSRGDLRDDEIVDMGRLAGRLFSHIFIHEPPETDGRRPGEISRLIAKGALQTGARPDSIRSVLPETESATACLRFARSGDLVALLMADVDKGRQLVESFKPRWKRSEEPGEL